MSEKLDLTKEDLYKILDVDTDATEKQIIKAYRKQALKCHPDKNPDNKTAAEEFHRLTQALEVLTDASAKAAYDKILKAKKAAQLRQKQFDTKRKKFKDDLDERERAAERQKQEEVSAARNLQAEIERLRKEGSRILEETQESLRRDIAEKLSKHREETTETDNDYDQGFAKIKAKWKIRKGQETNSGYTKEELVNIFSKYGTVSNLVLMVKKSGTAIIEFTSQLSADLAVARETGKPDFPLTLTLLSGQPMQGDSGTCDERLLKDTNSEAHQSLSEDKQFESYQQHIPPHRTVDNKDYESLVLMKMRQTEERKRLIEQAMKEDEEG